MKPVKYFMILIAAAAIIASCNKVSYQKAKSGMLYKIISSGKDSVVKEGQWLKLFYTTKLNDSVLQTNYGKMPVYVKVATNPQNAYNPAEIFGLLTKGDSAITVILVDSLLKKGLMQELPPFMKKGDRISTAFKVLEVFRNDSTYESDASAEAEKDRPRMMKEQAAEMEKRYKDQKEMQLKDEIEMEKSGDAARGIADMEAYLKAKNITAQKTGKGTFVVIKEQGTGPMADSGKYVTVKYAGRTLDKDSVFDAGTYPLKLGVAAVIAGWDEGLQLFKQGGKGTLYIPGFRAYGKRHPSFKPFQAMIFEVEMLNVSDTMPAQAMQPMPPRGN